MCTDKTGTLTEGRVVLEKYLDIYNQDSQDVLNYAFLNSYYQTGLENLMDVAVLKHEEVKTNLKIDKDYKKLDEIPFDFVRRRMSVVVAGPNNQNILICKGAVEEMMALCTKVKIKDKVVSLKRSKI